MLLVSTIDSLTPLCLISIVMKSHSNDMESENSFFMSVRASHCLDLVFVNIRIDFLLVSPLCIQENNEYATMQQLLLQDSESQV